MMPPEVTAKPTIATTHNAVSVVFSGRLVGVLFDHTPPVLTDAHTGQHVDYTLDEVLTDVWQAEPPMVGGRIDSQVTLMATGLQLGQRLGLRYPVDFDTTADCEIQL